MFERYTEGARRTVFFARYEAAQIGAVYIDSEHILLGLLREDKALFKRLLPDVEYESVHKEVMNHTQIEGGKRASTSTDLPLSNASKRVLAFGAEEAVLLNHRHIGTEHLLLGLLRGRLRNCQPPGLRAKFSPFPAWVTSSRL
jgi:ATP-dependent Clp protease ATP-binding subunit ClpC